MDQLFGHSTYNIGCFVFYVRIFPGSLTILRRTGTSQSIKLNLQFSLLALSPLYSYVNNTLQGLSTIRISHVDKVLQEEFYKHLDFNTAVTYLKSMTTRAFSAWVDGICLVYIGICSLTFVLYRGNGKKIDFFLSFINDDLSRTHSVK